MFSNLLLVTTYVGTSQKTTGQKKEDFCFEEFDQNAIRTLMEDQKKAKMDLE